MNNRLQLIKDFKNQNRKIFILFSLEYLLLFLALLAALIHSESFQPFLVYIILSSIVIMIHITLMIVKTFSTSNQRMNREVIVEHEQNFNKNSFTSLPDNQMIFHANGNTEDLFKNNAIEKPSSSLNQNNEIDKKIYETNQESILLLDQISSNSYSTIIIHENVITLKGQPEEAMTLHLSIPDNHNCIVTLDNITLQGSNQPAINLGNNSTVVLKLIGDNHIFHNGIRVPETADLTIEGEGDLTLQVEQSNRIGIGGTLSQSYGNITLATSGSIKINSSGNISLGIGGGQNPLNSTIKLLSGNIMVTTNGQSTLGIGSLQGNANVVIHQCNLNIKCDGTNAVGIGSLQGMVNITTCGITEFRCNGTRCVALGSLEGSGDIILTGGITQVYFTTNCGTALGTIIGILHIELQDGELLIHGEGSEIIGFGDHSGRSTTKVSYGLLSMQLFTSNAVSTATIPQKIIIDGGNIQCDFPDNIIPANSFGASLRPHIITDLDEFSQMIDTISYSYVYKAAHYTRYPYIKVYLPENQSIIR